MSLLRTLAAVCLLTLFATTAPAAPQGNEPARRLAYLVSDIRIPFWDIMSRGIRAKAAELGYHVEVYSAHNDAGRELAALAKVLEDEATGIILSPTNSSASVTILKLANRAGVPVVISDIGTEGGEYVSYIASDNRQGAYDLGRILARELRERGWQHGSVGIVAIPQRRANGRARTAGFMRAMNEAGIEGAGMRQQVTFSYEETYAFSRELITQNPNLRALWLQGSDRYQAALDAIADAGKGDDILLVCFDAEPEFLQLIPQGILAAAAMQQPFLMGERAVTMMHRHLQGQRVEKNVLLPVLAVSAENIERKMPIIRRNVLGMAAQ